MQPTDTFQPRDNNIASEDFDGEFVVLDLESGKYFSLAGGAAIVWRGLMAGHSVESLTAALSPGDSRAAGAAGLVASLVSHGLLVAAPGGVTTDTAVPAELAASTGGFEVSVFEDLADLLIADPIHDVDAQAGWPHKPNDA